MSSKNTAKNAADLPRWNRGECPKATRNAVYARDNHRCIYCGAIGDLTVDHIIPQSVFVDHRPTNLVTACSKCNSDRNVIDCDLFCRHVARRTDQKWKKIYKRVLRALATPVKE